MISVSERHFENADCVTNTLKNGYLKMKPLGSLLTGVKTAGTKAAQTTELKSEGLETLIRRAQDMDELAHKLRRGLAPNLAAALTAANVRESGELVVVCRGSGWAARMRYEADHLCKLAQDAGVEVTRCQVRVATE